MVNYGPVFAHDESTMSVDFCVFGDVFSPTALHTIFITFVNIKFSDNDQKTIISRIRHVINIDSKFVLIANSVMVLYF